MWRWVRRLLARILGKQRYQRIDRGLVVGAYGSVRVYVRGTDNEEISYLFVPREELADYKLLADKWIRGDVTEGVLMTADRMVTVKGHPNPSHWLLLLRVPRLGTKKHTHEVCFAVPVDLVGSLELTGTLRYGTGARKVVAAMAAECLNHPMATIQWIPVIISLSKDLAGTNNAILLVEPSLSAPSVLPIS